MLRRLCVALVLGTLLLAALVQGAAADPSGAKNSFAFTATCDGQQIDLAVNGNGDFTPGHVSTAPRSSSSKALPLLSNHPTRGSDRDREVRQVQAQPAQGAGDLQLRRFRTQPRGRLPTLWNGRWVLHAGRIVN
jgi:hypothetical protein